jgi:hypothetical protein
MQLPRQVSSRSHQGEMADAVAKHRASQAVPRPSKDQGQVVNHASLSAAMDQMHLLQGQAAEPGI